MAPPKSTQIPSDDDEDYVPPPTPHPEPAPTPAPTPVGPAATPTKQHKKRVGKTPVRRENAAAAGVPGQVQFPAEVPRAIAQNLRQYFVQKNSNVRKYTLI